MRYLRIIVITLVVAMLSTGCIVQVDTNGQKQDEEGRAAVEGADEHNGNKILETLVFLEDYVIDRIEEVTKKKIDDILVEDLDKVTWFNLNVEDTKNKVDLNFLTIFPNLEELTLIHVESTDYSILSKLANLKHLRFIGGNINEHTEAIASLSNLNYLGIEQNRIDKITFLEGLTNLNELSLYANDISSLDGIQNLNQLERLSLRNNAIIYIEELEAISNLKFLELSDNKIRDISTLGELTNLEHLDLWKNNITDISPLMPLRDNLTSLFVSSNQIRDIDFISQFNKLTFLDISNNPISDMNNLKVQTLKRLHMGRTDIDDLSFVENNPNLRFLDMRNTNVKSIRPLTNLEYLEILLLDFEQIEDLDLLKDKDIQISNENILG